jgi:hypothetical protein
MKVYLRYSRSHVFSQPHSNSIFLRMPSSGMLLRAALVKNRRLLVAAKVVPCPSILVTLMMEALHFSETVTRRYIPEDDVLHDDRRENL